MTGASAAAFLAGEAASLMTRLDAVRSFSITIPMVAAAAIPARAMQAIEDHLAVGRRILRDQVMGYLDWIRGPGRESPVEAQQRRLTFLKLRFNTELDQLDIFADALTQRGEHEHGLWLAGLDVVASDSLSLTEPFFTAPPVVTYLDRGHGAAIRRARTRLPGGGDSPVALIRVPRERMVGGGIGASLIHEAGHQGAALLDLNTSLGQVLRSREARAGGDRPAWTLWRRWIGEITADLWSLAHLGAGGTAGLIGVVSLPRPFVFRISPGDPHPFPWIRVKLSCAVGRILYPDPQWNDIEAFWEEAYPRHGLPPAQQVLLKLLEATAPELGGLLLNHRPRSLRGRRLVEIFPVADRSAPRLRRLFSGWRQRPAAMCGSRPTLVLAALGQARLDGRLGAEEEASTLTRLLTGWAARRAGAMNSISLDCQRRVMRRTAA